MKKIVRNRLLIVLFLAALFIGPYLLSLAGSVSQYPVVCPNECDVARCLDPTYNPEFDPLHPELTWNVLPVQWVQLDGGLAVDGTWPYCEEGYVKQPLSSICVKPITVTREFTGSISVPDNMSAAIFQYGSMYAIWSVSGPAPISSLFTIGGSNFSLVPPLFVSTVPVSVICPSGTCFILSNSCLLASEIYKNYTIDVTSILNNYKGQTVPYTVRISAMASPNTLDAFSIYVGMIGGIKLETIASIGPPQDIAPPSGFSSIINQFFVLIDGAIAWLTALFGI